MLIVSLSAGNIFSQTIDYAEYFFDTDPGVRSTETTEIPSLSMVGDSVVKNIDFDVSSLGIGYHWLTIRVQDDLGRWSIAKSHKFYIYDDTYTDLTKPPADITGFEYLFDDDTGAGTGTWISAMMSGDSAVKTTDIPTTGLSPGYHKLITRTRDADGLWSTSVARKFYIYDTTYTSLTREAAKLVAAEYYFDEDTIPQGQGNALSITPGDEVEWSGNISVEGLQSGKHVLFIRVRDSIGLWSLAHAKLFNVVDLTTETNSPICQGTSDGKAKVTVEGGIPPFTYLWDDPFQQTADSAIGLSTGTYTVIVTDAEGAILKESVTITEYDTIQINITTSDTECNEANGSATATATGENPSFDYLWTNGSTDQSASELRSGVHVVTVTDAEGCTNTAVATINDIGGPEITVKAIQHLKCAGDADGIIDIDVSGGTPPYIYSWSNGESTQDLMGLKAGTYEIIVTDANGCLAAKSIRVEAPPPLTFSLSVNPSDCGLTTGSATVSVSGGTIPYYYDWEGFPSPHSATRENLGAGVYTVTVTDDNSCTAVARVAVSEAGAPTVNIISVIQSTCGNTDGQILISVSGGTGSYTYDWKKEGESVSTSKNLTGVGPGEYDLVVSDGSGCMTYAAATIPAELPPAQQICLVTVDTVSNKNLVVWTKHAGLGIVSYKIYRETTSAGVFNLIATRPYDSLSSFIDTMADPAIRSWRYKISAIDGCGNESRLSNPHKTMHLTINVGILNSFNLIWNHYEGFVPFNNTYNIWRWSNDTWTMISSVPSNLNSYTDFDAPEGLLWYYVEAVHPTGCTPTKAGTLNSSRSNRQSRLKYGEGIENPFLDLYNLRVYPNPGNGVFNLSMENLVSEDLNIKVFDQSGRLLYINKLYNQRDKLEQQIDLSGYAEGIYHLYLQTDKGIFNRLLIIE
jgi:hypothetical protein